MKIRSSPVVRAVGQFLFFLSLSVSTTANSQSNEDYKCGWQAKSVGGRTFSCVPVKNLPQQTPKVIHTDLASSGSRELQSESSSLSSANVSLKKIIRKKSTRKKSTVGFIVLATGDTAAIVTRLKEIDEHEYLVLTHPPYARKVSLGVYLSREYAQRRQVALKPLGINSRVVDRSEEFFVKERGNLHSQSKVVNRPAPESVETFVAVAAGLELESDMLNSIIKVTTEKMNNPDNKMFDNEFVTGSVVGAGALLGGDYLVATLSGSVNIISQLLTLDISDYTRLDYLGYADRYSLGSYDNIESALARKAELQDLGINSALIGWEGNEEIVAVAAKIMLR